MRRTLLRELGEFVVAVQDRELEAVSGRGVLGSAEITKRRERMEISIQAALRWQRCLVWIPIGITIALFVLTSVLVIKWSGDARLLSAVMTASGLSMALPLRWMTKVLRELWYNEVIGACLPSMTHEELAEFLKIILNQLDQMPQPAARRSHSTLVAAPK